MKLNFKNKKTIIMFISIFICVICIVVFAISSLIKNDAIYANDTNHNKNSSKTITLSSWLDRDKKITILNNVNLIGEATVPNLDGQIFFESHDSIEEIVEKNKEYFVEYINALTENSKDALFFYDNSYYLLLKDDEIEDNFIFENYNSILCENMDNEGIFPCPREIYLSHSIFNNCQEAEINVLDFLYDKCTYEKAKEFYDRFEKGIATYDDVTEKIRVAMYNPRTEELKKDMVILDFKNRTVTWTDSKGVTSTSDGSYDAKYEVKD